MVISVRGSDNQERKGRDLYVNIERLRAVEWIDIVIFSIVE